MKLLSVPYFLRMLDRIRTASPEDAEQIRSIYDPIVRETAISFELEPPGLDETRRRIEHTMKSFPWLVWDDAGELNGYAYATRFRDRPAYDRSTEISVYVEESVRRRGVARGLIERLTDDLRRREFATAIAGITLPNPASVALFESLGFTHVGVFERVGYKFGTWHDVGFWQRHLLE